jgi:hypothetical protein
MRRTQRLLICMQLLPTQAHEKPTLAYALATLGLTAVHHVYGGLVYDTPWRIHGLVAAKPIALALCALYAIHRRRPSERAGRAAGFGLALVALVFPVALTGAFEGFYNHTVKNVLYFAGVSRPVLLRMFPPPTYELPNDAIFEISGVLQVVPALLAGIAAVRLISSLSPQAVRS